MNIYKIESYVWVNLGDPESDEYDEDDIHKTTFEFSYGSYALEDAVAEGIDFMNENFEQWEFKNVSLVAENVINWPDTDDEPDWTGDCECPYCSANNGKTPLDLIMNFEHDCGNKIKCSDNGWLTLRCKQCGEWLSRDQITRNEKGILIFNKKIEETKKE